ncbi:MAG: ABC transporter permease [Candidatus Neomarinimicrobiota bacterium]
MTQEYLEKTEKAELSSKFEKKSIIRWLKFYLTPGWRDPKLSAREHEIGKFKSKRKKFRRFLTPLTILGFIMILIVVFCAFYAPWLTPYTLKEVTKPTIIPGGRQFAPPSADHPLGTTENAYDLLGRLLWGARTVLTMGFIPVLISVACGLVIGTISAYFGGTVDAIIMRLCDLVFAFPQLLLVILVIPILGYEIFWIMLIFGLLGIPQYVRLMRSSVLLTKHNLYVDAAHAGGADNFKVMFKHIVPNAISPILISFFGLMGTAILGFSAIAFLGMSQETRIADWGTDIYYARGQFNAPWAAIWPGFFIAIAVIGFMLIGDGLRDALDPRLNK